MSNLTKISNLIKLLSYSDELKCDMDSMIEEAWDNIYDYAHTDTNNAKYYDILANKYPMLEQDEDDKYYDQLLSQMGYKQMFGAISLLQQS